MDVCKLLVWSAQRSDSQSLLFSQLITESINVKKIRCEAQTQSDGLSLFIYVVELTVQNPKIFINEQKVQGKAADPDI